MIIILDDDSDILESLTLSLEMENYKVVAVDTEKKLFQFLEKVKPDLILLDYWLSGRNGDEVARELKDKAATKNIPIVFMSANSKIKDIAKKTGVNDWLLKPCSLDEVISVIEKNVKN